MRAARRRAPCADPSSGAARHLLPQAGEGLAAHAPTGPHDRSLRPARPRPSPPSPPRATKRRWRRCASPRSARRARSPRCSRRWARCRPTSARAPGAAINALKDEVTEALAARRASLKALALDARLEARGARRDACRCAAPAIETGRIHPISQVIDELTAIFADMGFCDRRRAGHRERRLQFHQAQLPARPSGARDARHVLLRARRQRRAQAAAHPHQPGAGAHHAQRRSRRSASSAPAAPIAATPTRPTRRCSIRSRGW